MQWDRNNKGNIHTAWRVMHSAMPAEKSQSQMLLWPLAELQQPPLTSGVLRAASCTGHSESSQERQRGAWAGADGLSSEAAESPLQP